MYKSRLGRLEEKRQQRRIALAAIGSIGLVVFLAVFGVKMLIAFSLFVDKIRGSTPITQEKNILFPPEFDPIPEATNSSRFFVNGTAQPETTILLLVNDEETKKIPVPKDGTFHVDNIVLKEGANTISGKLTDEKNNTSDLSEVLRIAYKKTKPTIEITAPDDNATITGDQASVQINGKTEESVRITINSRFVVVNSNGSFSYTLPLSEGEQTYKIIATDTAGNVETLERKITYKK